VDRHGVAVDQALVDDHPGRRQRIGDWRRLSWNADERVVLASRLWIESVAATRNVV
jgi:hypothetical protein